jgi:hypothetical protein
MQFEIKIVITEKGYMKIRREANVYVKIYSKNEVYESLILGSSGT